MIKSSQNKQDVIFFFLAANLSEHLPLGLKLMELHKACGSLHRKPPSAMSPESLSASPCPTGAVGQVVTEQHCCFSLLRAVSPQSIEEQNSLLLEPRDNNYVGQLSQYFPVLCAVLIQHK